MFELIVKFTFFTSSYLGHAVLQLSLYIAQANFHIIYYNQNA